MLLSHVRTFASSLLTDTALIKKTRVTAGVPNDIEHRWCHNQDDLESALQPLPFRHFGLDTDELHVGNVLCHQVAEKSDLFTINTNNVSIVPCKAFCGTKKTLLRFQPPMNDVGNEKSASE